MSMALAHAGISNSHKSSLLQCSNIFGAAVAHPCAQSAHILSYYFGYVAFISHPTFNTLRHQLFNAILHILEIAVATTLLHRTNTAHASVFLKLSAFVNDGF